MSAESLVLNDLYALVQQRLAIVLDAHRRVDVEHALREALARGEAASMAAALRQLDSAGTDTPLWQRVIRAAAIGETYFFRDSAQIHALRTQVLPGLIAERRARGELRLRLWSAGCSTGEEPYTLAIVLRELLPDFAQWSITLLATDLSAHHLERAANGLYRPWSFRGETPADVRARWFRECREGYHVDPTLRSMVTFAPLNLASEAYPSPASNTIGMDVIVCRNVLIYFDSASSARVIERLYGALAPQGWLVLGHAEAGCAQHAPLEPRPFENTVLYRRPAAPPLAARAVPALAPLARPVPALPEQPPAPAPPPAAAPEADAFACAARAADREQWQEALDWLGKAERASGGLRPDVHYLRGIVAIHQQHSDLAIEALRRAIYCDAGFVMAYFTLGEVYARRGDHPRAASHWQQVRQMLAGQPAGSPVPAGGDLTVEMLARLVQYRLDGETLRTK